LKSPGITKDTVAAGFGSRLPSFSRLTRLTSRFKGWFQDLPSLQLAYLAAIFARWGHEVRTTEGPFLPGDLAIVLSSLVDYRREVSWCEEMRRRGVRVGLVGMAVSCLPELFRDHADFLILGEPEAAATAIARGERPNGLLNSPPMADLDALPFPRWDLVGADAGAPLTLPLASRPFRGVLPVLASRGCSESCTYCPHRVLGGYRARSTKNVADELEHLCHGEGRYVVFRDPIFTRSRERCLELCAAIAERGLKLHFECETRLDCLDESLIDSMMNVGLRALTFGVETTSPAVLRRVARRPVPDAHQKAVIAHCRRRHVSTTAFYMIGFPEDDQASIGATIAYAVELGSTFAQFKLLTPYPGTPLWKQLAHRVYERDWERFDGFTPTFQHPSLTPEQLRDRLGAAYTRFYGRPSYVADYCGLRSHWLRAIFHAMDRATVRRPPDSLAWAAEE